MARWKGSERFEEWSLTPKTNISDKMTRKNRVEWIVAKLEAMKLTGKEVYNDIFVSIIVNALPKDFYPG
ncbi:hypothetical protein E2C01_050133 [Portunus trituberculatus]|uniref:Uncharacterized protein n=1 Tax=Portunus trituberculatus TaxID=210409 RepID=A0A5B7G7F7_PORTR|nr:hypothetical protein [Portunus trituberculatus]